MLRLDFYEKKIEGRLPKNLVSLNFFINIQHTSANFIFKNSLKESGKKNFVGSEFFYSMSKTPLQISFAKIPQSAYRCP